MDLTEQAEAARRREKIEKALLQFPQRMLNDFDPAKLPNAKAYVEVMAMGRLTGVLAVGRTRQGKSFTIQQLGKKLILEGRKVIYWSCPKLADKISAMSSKDSHEFNEFVETLERTDVLILDDLGAEKDTPRVTATLHRIIDTRHAEGKIIIASTNCESEELQQQLQDFHGRTIARLREMTKTIRF